MASDRARDSSVSEPKVVMLVILDTSALIYPFQTGVDFVKGIREMVLAPATFAVTDGVVRELESIRRGRSPSLSMAAEKALAFSKDLKVLHSDATNTDEQIVTLAKETGAAVATADSLLRKELRKRRIPVVFVSKGKRIRIEGNFPSASVV
jgi:rRNA-processing protein FCF1